MESGIEKDSGDHRSQVAVQLFNRLPDRRDVSMVLIDGLTLRGKLCSRMSVTLGGEASCIATADVLALDPAIHSSGAIVIEFAVLSLFESHGLRFLRRAPGT